MKNILLEFLRLPDSYTHYNIIKEKLKNYILIVYLYFQDQEVFKTLIFLVLLLENFNSIQRMVMPDI